MSAVRNWPFVNGTPQGTTRIYLNDDTLKMRSDDFNTGARIQEGETTSRFRDPSAWYHFCLVFNRDDDPQGLLWVNNVEQPINRGTVGGAGYEWLFNRAGVETRIGSYIFDATGQLFDGYLADMHWVDGYSRP